MVSLDRCVESCNSFNDLSTTVCFPDNTDLNLNVFNTNTGINESKTLTKHMSCKSECNFDGKKSNSKVQ